MIRLGRVYAGLMIDVQATNEKLVRRSENILAQLTGKSRERARAALGEAEGSVKLALLLLEGIALDDARRALQSSGGDLRAAKEMLASERNHRRRA